MSHPFHPFVERILSSSFALLVHILFDVVRLSFSNSLGPLTRTMMMLPRAMLRQSRRLVVVTSSSSSLCLFSTNATPPKHAMLPTDAKVPAPPMVYIAGEEMTHYACELFTKEWFAPYFDLSAWERFDLSCKARDDSNDQVLHDAVAAGKRVGAIFKEPTITPSAEQVKEFGLSKALGSPNVSSWCYE